MRNNNPNQVIINTTDAKRQGYLKKDRQERFNMKRAWFVTAWRVVDASGTDLFQPWRKTKGEARSVADELGIEIIGEQS